MNVAQFNIEFEEFLSSLIERVKRKQIEYSRNDNPFHNFEKDAQINDISPALSLHNYMSKHLVSYLDMIDDINVGRYINPEYSKEKLGDIIAYMGILQVWNQNQPEPTELPF